MREAKLRAEPSCGVADNKMRVSERVANNLANLARFAKPCSPERAATLWHSSMTIMSHQAFSK